MMSPSDSRVLYESQFSIFNGRLCSLRILLIPQSETIFKIRVTSPSDASILLENNIAEQSDVETFVDVLKMITNARSQDPTILGPRVEPSPGEPEFPYRLVIDPISPSTDAITLPLCHASPQERCDYVLQLYAREKAQHQIQIEKSDELSKQLQNTIVDYNSMKTRCEFQEKEIALLRQLAESNSNKNKRARDDSENTPSKKRRCGCGDEESCGSDCDGEIDEDEEDDMEADAELFRAATSQLQLSGRGSHNVEVSSGEGGSNDNDQMNLMKQLEKLSSVIVKAPNLPSTSSMSTMHIKMENNQEQSGPIVLQSQGTSEDQNSVKKVVGVVQYVICQLCPEEEQKSMDPANQQQMQEHFLDKHVDKEKRKCEACPTDQFQPHNIGQHYRLHTNSVYACQHCGKRGRRNYLMSHVRTHTGERPYRCDTCSKSFSDASTLRRHRLVHTGEKKYQCPVCGRAIARKDNVKVHIRSHGIHA
ncbi:unnamed protein product [Caenorhabditis nigoni]